MINFETSNSKGNIFYVLEKDMKTKGMFWFQLG